MKAEGFLEDNMQGVFKEIKVGKKLPIPLIMNSI